MKNKFTKGEWKREGRTVFIPVYNDKAGCETVNMILEKEEGEAEANAKLIAAAPAMYQALKKIHVALGMFDADYGKEMTKGLQLADLDVYMAIKRATE